MYSGRFAPSPTGPLHLGSLLAGVASWLDARFHQGKWIVRIEDIDPPREVIGSSDRILHSLEAHGLYWDGEVEYQSRRIDLYLEYLSKLQKSHFAYPCDCSRSDVERAGGIYNGRCRNRSVAPNGEHAWRFKMSGAREWQDVFAGVQAGNSAALLADPVIWRRDGLVAYQLAVVIDDALMGINHVIRGADLLESTPAQIAILDALGKPRPRYGHIPVILGKDGQKLSKQNQARALSDSEANDNISQTLILLGQKLPTELEGASTSKQLGWAADNWDRSAVPRIKAIRL